MNQEPVVSAASVAGLISAGISLAVLMGWLNLTEDQFAQLMIFLSLALPIGGAFIARRSVTPVSNPRAENTRGELVDLVPADGSQLKEDWK